MTADIVGNQESRRPASGPGARSRRASAEEAPAPIRVIAADDSYLIREFLTETLTAAPEVDLVAVCSNAVELWAAIDAHEPDVVLTDIRMPPSGGAEGVQIAARLRESHPRVGVVVLSQYAEPVYALGLLGEGTGGRAYLIKERIRDSRELLARDRGSRARRLGRRSDDRRRPGPGANPRRELTLVPAHRAGA